MGAVFLLLFSLMSAHPYFFSWFFGFLLRAEVRLRKCGPFFPAAETFYFFFFLTMSIQPNHPIFSDYDRAVIETVAQSDVRFDDPYNEQTRELVDAARAYRCPMGASL